MYTEATDSAYEHLIRHITVVPGRDDLSTIGLAVSLSHLSSIKRNLSLTPHVASNGVCTRLLSSISPASLEACSA